MELNSRTRGANRNVLDSSNGETLMIFALSELCSTIRDHIIVIHHHLFASARVTWPFERRLRDNNSPLALKFSAAARE